MRVRTFRVCADLAPKQGHKGLNRVRSAPHDPEVDAFTYGQWDGMNYRLATPKGNRPANRPLVVWLHGNGEGGVSADEYNNESQLRANRGARGEVPAAESARRSWLAQVYAPRFRAPAEAFRSQLVARYGPQRGSACDSAEAFELSEYGRQPSPQELRALFPF